MQFEWDDDKAAINERKHGVSFTEAMTVFADPMSLTCFDPDHSVNEDRYITMGQSAEGHLLTISHTDRNENVRIISARPATRMERKDYFDANFP